MVAAYRAKRGASFNEVIDGRFNKCRGWNSLDGHVIGVLYDNDGEKKR